MTALIFATIATLAQVPADSFPHAPHRRMFASCLTCHAGVVTGDTAQARPAAAGCAACHDGAIAARVSWRPRAVRPTNLRFDHRVHARVVATRGDSVMACTTCHASSDGPPAFMNAGTAKPPACLSCHAHRAPTHLAAVDCASCHTTLRASTRLAISDIARFSKPASHDTSYVFGHGRDAGSRTCAFCHTRESCAACHVNAARLPSITVLGSDARVAALVAASPDVVYPLPGTHRRATFSRSHGSLAAAAGATCASCHARESCLGCHRDGERLAVIAALPVRARDGARGVLASHSRPPDHLPGFALRHREAAAGGEQSCRSCHAPAFCASCHDGRASPPFHAANFVTRHGAESFGNTTECATCHQPEAFCTSCHRETGRASQTGAVAGKYHDAQPRWAFGHGGAARRSIETCASCHRQTDCMQCHSASRGQRVSPHGPGFDPGIESRNPTLCARCHVNGTPRR